MRAGRYRCRVDYDGSHYSGWQSQKSGVPTVQETIELCLSILMGRRPVQVVGCGRTDAGVHAKGYVFHTDLPEASLEEKDLLYKVNKLLPDDILVTDVRVTQDNFHARFNAISRSYEYRLTASSDPFLRYFTTRYPYRASNLSIDHLQAAADLLIGKHDFTAFCKTGSDVKTKWCDVSESRWYLEDNVFTYRITADRFLRGMIRLVVGMCCNVSRGQLTTVQVQQAIANAHRLPQDWSMPPEGLMLCDIRY